jgi:hypothetical protein
VHIFTGRSNLCMVKKERKKERKPSWKVGERFWQIDHRRTRDSHAIAALQVCAEEVSQPEFDAGRFLNNTISSHLNRVRGIVGRWIISSFERKQRCSCGRTDPPENEARIALRRRTFAYATEVRVE